MECTLELSREKHFACADQLLRILAHLFPSTNRNGDLNSVLFRATKLIVDDYGGVEQAVNISVK